MAGRTPIEFTRNKAPDRLVLGRMTMLETHAKDRLKLQYEPRQRRNMA